MGTYLKIPFYFELFQWIYRLSGYLELWIVIEGSTTEREKW